MTSRLPTTFFFSGLLLAHAGRSGASSTSERRGQRVGAVQRREDGEQRDPGDDQPVDVCSRNPRRPGCSASDDHKRDRRAARVPRRRGRRNLTFRRPGAPRRAPPLGDLARAPSVGSRLAVSSCCRSPPPSCPSTVLRELPRSKAASSGRPSPAASSSVSTRAVLLKVLAGAGGTAIEQRAPLQPSTAGRGGPCADRALGTQVVERLAEHVLAAPRRRGSRSRPSAFLRARAADECRERQAAQTGDDRDQQDTTNSGSYPLRGPTSLRRAGRRRPGRTERLHHGGAPRARRSASASAPKEQHRPTTLPVPALPPQPRALVCCRGITRASAVHEQESAESHPARCKAPGHVDQRGAAAASPSAHSCRTPKAAATRRAGRHPRRARRQRRARRPLSAPLHVR